MKVSKYERWKGPVQFRDQTGYSVTFSLGGDEVDILPAFHIIETE